LVGDRHLDNERTLGRRLPGTPIWTLPRFEHLGPEALDAWLDDHDLEALWP
jgi:hypothetical protein